MNRKWVSSTICINLSGLPTCRPGLTSSYRPAWKPVSPTPQALRPGGEKAMKGDFTRDTFDPRRQFTRVLMQQGRVQLDADWNEQASILLHYLRGLAADLIGPHGGPTDNLGFDISVPSGTHAGDFAIGPGIYYVAGLRCETAGTSYASQTDYPLTDDDKLKDQPFPYLA